MKYIKRFDEYLSTNINKVKKIYDIRNNYDIDHNKEFIFKEYYSRIGKDVAYVLFYNDMDVDFYLNMPKDKSDEYENIISEILKEYDNNTYLNKDSLTRKYLYDKFIFYIINNYDDRDDTVNSMKFSNVVKNQWLIHLTTEDKAEQIRKEGFRGVTDYLNLSYSHSKKIKSKEYDGYGYAFTIPDFLNLLNDKEKPIKSKYGFHAMIFKSSGVRVHHKGDNEYQTIFYTKDASNINIIFYTSIYNSDTKTFDVKYGVAVKYGVDFKKNADIKKRNFLVLKDTIEECIEWFTTNYDQYKKYLN